MHVPIRVLGRLRVSGAAIAFVLMAAGCGGGSSSASSPSSTGTVAGTQTTGNSIVIATRKLPHLGTVLVDSRGHTLYLFAPDKHSQVTCTGTCAAVWPPLRLTAGTRAQATGQAQASLLGSDPNPAGGRVVTYNGWPLYTYVADSTAGAAKGQAIKLNGGYWYVVSPGGNPIKTKQTGSSRYSNGGYG